MLDRFETFATTVALLNRCLQRIKAQEMNRLELKGTHVMCLYALGKQPEGMTASELCRAIGEDKAAVSRTVGELAARSFVEVSCETDRRYRAKIRPTEQGLEAISYVNGCVERALDAVGEVMDDAQRDSFYDSLGKVAERLRLYVEEISE